MKNKKNQYNLELDNLLKKVKKQGILVKTMEKGRPFLFDKQEQYKKPLGTIPIKNMFGNITNVYKVYEDHDGSIKYYDYPQFTKKEIEKQRQLYEKRESQKMSRTEFLKDMHEAYSFDLSEEEVSQYFERISQYINKHSYNEIRFRRQEIHLIESLTARQETCSELAIDCLFKRDFVQALHETLDVISNFNDKKPLNYSEYILIRNILTVYEHVK